MPTIAPPSVSVIIPVANGGPNFSKCLQSLSADQTSAAEVIVVADGDTDGSWRLAYDFGARVLKTSEPSGPACARNLGARHAGGDILFFVDADVLVPENAVDLVASTFQQDPDLSALFGSYDDSPFEGNFLSQYKNLFHHYVHQNANEDAATFWTGCGAIRREVFLEFGGFDEGYRRPCIEDIELGYRLKRAGHRIRLLKNLQVKHLKRWGPISLLKADFFYRALPWTDLILNESRILNDLNLKTSDRVSVVSVYLLGLALLGTIFSPLFLLPILPLMLLIFWLNRDLYRFFTRSRGIVFTLEVVPWHWFYFLYSGMAFAVGFTRHLWKKPSSGSVFNNKQGEHDASHKKSRGFVDE